METAERLGVGTGTAHAKVILLGEHTVVHGTAAIALPLHACTVTAYAYSAPPPAASMPGVAMDLAQGGVHVHRLTAGSPVRDLGAGLAVKAALRRWDRANMPVSVLLDSRIPPGRGLGSSAACAGAAVRATAALVGASVDRDTLYELVQVGERRAHGRPSGVDAATTIAAQPIWFQGGTVTPLRIGSGGILVVADTGVCGSTEHAVGGVGAYADQHPGRAAEIMSRATAILDSARRLLGFGALAEVGELLLEFHSLLTELGVGSADLDRLVEAALDAGALGAKLTGGGLGGCIVALADNRCDIPGLEQGLRSAGAVRTWRIPFEGASR